MTIPGISTPAYFNSSLFGDKEASGMAADGTDVHIPAPQQIRGFEGASLQALTMRQIPHQQVPAFRGTEQLLKGKALRSVMVITSS